VYLSACGGAANADQAAPTVAITSAAAASGSDVVFSFAFSEALTSGSFAAADVVLTGATAGAFTMVDSSHATLQVTPTNTNVSVSVAASKFEDLAHNANTQAASRSIVASAPARALVWSDEFTTNGLPDSSKWAYDTYANQTGWFNSELQYYANARLQNSSIASGVLTLTAIKERLSSLADYGNQNYSSVRLTTNGKYSFTYGYVEVRAKLPCAQGTWPAIWMLGTATANSGVGPDAWPAHGEIDIMEQRGITVPADKQTVLGTLHTTAQHGGSGITASTPLMDACTAFHNYQLTWSADRIQIGVDGTVYNTFDKPAGADSTVWPFSTPQYLLLNVAMGGTLGGAVPSSFVADSMQVEYVRVYQ
jgi:beta-glucanase (GH16 family)